MVKINVLFFATFRELSGLRQIEQELPEGTDVKTLRQRLSSQFPAMAPYIPTALVCDQP